MRQLIELSVLKPFRKYPFWKYLHTYRKQYALGLFALLSADAINVALPLLIRSAIDAMPRHDFRRIEVAGALYLLLMGLQAVGRYLWRIYLIGTSHYIARELRIDLYRHLQSLPLDYYQQVRTGDLMSRATNDIESIRMAVGPGILVTADALMMFVLIIPVMFMLSFKLSLLAFAFYPLVPWITARIGDRIDVMYESLQVRMSQMSAYAQESFGAIRLIKSLVLESRVHRHFSSLSGDYATEGVRLAKYQAAFTPALGFLTNLGTFLILLLGGRDVMAGLITVGTFVAFQRFVVQLSWPMEAIGWTVTMNREGVAAHRRLLQILQVVPAPSVRKGSLRSSRPGALLEIRHLQYAYEGARGGQSFHLDLAGLSLRRGRKIGLVGPVGAGKTTFFNLLLRLYEPPTEAIFFEGEDITSIPVADLRRHMASVEQHIHLFSEQIAVNVGMGMEGKVSDTEIRASAEIACISEEIGELDLGFATILGERGINLSGGQKQRIALARALVRHPDLLLLDDCFSAVDVAVENRIIENFFTSYPDLSVCFASHRLSIMPRMDEIWLIDRGGLLDQGPHHELLRRDPLYQELWEKSERRIEAERFEAGVLAEGTLE